MKEDEFVHLTVIGEITERERITLLDAEIAVSRADSLIGGEVISEIVAVAASPVVLKILQDFILGLIDRGKTVRIKTKDIEIDGVSYKQANELLEKLSSEASVKESK